MQVSIISLGVFNHTGGPTKTIRDFKRALNAEVYSFCEQSALRKHKLAIAGARPVVSSSLPVLSQFCYAGKGTKEAEAAVRASDIVSCHSFYRYHALWTNRVCKTAGVPYWFVPHGILDPWVIQKNHCVKQLYWKFGGERFLRDASTIIFSTRAERDKAAEQFHLPRTEIVPWSVELIDTSDYEAIRIRVRKEFGIPEGAHVLLYFGRLHPMKRPLNVIESIGELKGSDIHLIIVGNEDGITEADCTQLARSLGIEKRVHFTGPVYREQKINYLFASDAYISLSYRENFNHAAAESLAAGLPVILSPGNDLRSELSGVGCCLEIEDESLQSAVNAIKEFTDLSLPKLREMGLLGRKWVEANLSFDLFKTRLLDLHMKYAKSAAK